VPIDDEILGWQDRARRLWPFAVVVVLTCSLGLIPPILPGTADLLLAAGGCFALVGILTVVVPWQRLPLGSAMAVIVIFCWGVGLLREAGGSEANGGGYWPLLLLPIIWQALYGRPVELWATITAVTATLVVPIVVVGGAEYPASQWRLVLLFTLVGATTGLVVQRLVTATGELNRQLEGLATRDQLTGLPNRRAWDQALTTVLADRPAPGSTAIALLDLDHFKAFNDAHGHIGGDQALQLVARQWTGRLGTGRFLARWGGEELALLCTDAAGLDLTALLRELAAATPHGLTFSAGLVVLGRGSDHLGSPDRAMRTVDDLLYRAKRGGRACVASATLEGHDGEAPAATRIVLEHLFDPSSSSTSSTAEPASAAEPDLPGASVAVGRGAGRPGW